MNINWVSCGNFILEKFCEHVFCLLINIYIYIFSTVFVAITPLHVDVKAIFR